MKIEDRRTAGCRRVRGRRREGWQEREDGRSVAEV